MNPDRRAQRILKKMTPGTMGGESRVARRPVYDNLVIASGIPAASTGCPRFLGPLNGEFTNGIGIRNASEFAFISFSGEVPSICWTAIPSAVPESGLFPFEVHPTIGGFVNGNIAVRDTGEVYYINYDDTGSGVPGRVPLYKQSRSGTNSFFTWLDNVTWGPNWNPYDDKLYDFDGGFSGSLRRIDPDTGETSIVAGPFTGDGIQSDIPVFTPDGGVWFYADFHPCRYDIDTGTYEIFYDVIIRDISGSPVPAVGTPYANPGDVYVELAEVTGGGPPYTAARVSSTGAVSTTVSCAPFADEDGNETARSASTKISGRWVTIFIWPTGGGSGYLIWLSGL